MISRSDVRLYGDSPIDFDSFQNPKFSITALENKMSEIKYQKSTNFDMQDDSFPIDEMIKNLLATPKLESEFLENNPGDKNEYLTSTKKYIRSPNLEVKTEFLQNANIHTESLSIDSQQEPIAPFGYDLQDSICSDPLTPDKSYHSSSPSNENDTLSSSYCTPKSDDMDYMDDKPTCRIMPDYDTASLMYANDDLTTFSAIVNCDEILSRPTKLEGSHDSNSSYPNELKIKLNKLNDTVPFRSTKNSNNIIRNDIFKSSEAFNEHDQQNPQQSCLLDRLEDQNSSIFERENKSEDNRKGKITCLQKKALDSIFYVTDRPSRGLVLHIAGELSLHHITVKNFFSNGRRRLRRAAARINDPEKTKRENQKRKEKRRLAALAAAATASNEVKNVPSAKNCDKVNENTPPKEPPVLSPERKALMEKLAVKVQRSVAQKEMAANLNESSNNISTNGYYRIQYNTERSFCPQNFNNNLNIHSEYMSKSEPKKRMAENVFNHKRENFEVVYNYGEYKQPAFSTTKSNITNISNHSFEIDSISSYHEQPYSPTSWQTLLHS